MLVVIAACPTGAAPQGASGYYGTSFTTTTADTTDASAGESTAVGSGGGEDVSSDGAAGSSGQAASSGPGEGSSGGVPMCGNGVVEGDEACDGSDLGGNDCTDFGYDEGVLACDQDCHAITDACLSCGDGEISLTEVCEATDFDGETCTSLGFGGGALLCEVGCKSIDTSGCIPLPTCGDGVRNGGEQCDGNDVGGSSCASQGFDQGTLGCTPGCTFDVAECMDDLTNCGMMGDFCLFDENDIQSTCCPAGVGGNVLGICNVVVCV